MLTCGQQGALCQGNFNVNHLNLVLKFKICLSQGPRDFVALSPWTSNCILLIQTRWNTCVLKQSNLFLCETSCTALNINIITKDLKLASNWKLAKICLCIISQPFLAGSCTLLPLARCLWSKALDRCSWGTIWAKYGNATLHDTSDVKCWWKKDT